MDAIENKVALTQLSNFHPTHAVDIARHFRRTEGKDWCQRRQLPWLATLQKYSVVHERMARRYLQIFREWDRIQSDTVSDLGVAAVLNFLRSGEEEPPEEPAEADGPEKPEDPPAPPAVFIWERSVNGKSKPDRTFVCYIPASSP